MSETAPKVQGNSEVNVPLHIKIPGLVVSDLHDE